MSLSTDQHVATSDLIVSTAHGGRPPDLNVHPQDSSSTPPPSQLSTLETKEAHGDRPPDLVNDQHSSSTLPPSRFSFPDSSDAILDQQIILCVQGSVFFKVWVKFIDEIDIDNIILNTL